MIRDNNNIKTIATAASFGVLIGIGITTIVINWGRRSTPKSKEEQPKRQRPHDNGTHGEAWELQPIGIVRSCYRLCVGTPRQGMLAPHARGRIELTIDPDALDGLDEFGYVWIVFGFHLNTIGARTRTKIAAPARGASDRVGVLATRSPHRFNCIGITLAKLDGIELLLATKRQRRRHGSTSGDIGRRRPKRIPSIRISGHDLVDGTPVFDIKPYVANYDAVPKALVPDWVGEGLKSKRTVRFVESALVELTMLVPSLEFYDSVDDVRYCIEEVLAVDVRSAWQTKKARSGQFQAERSKRLTVVQELSSSMVAASASASPPDGGGGGACTQQLDNLLISYTVDTPLHMQRQESIGSGAEDIVTVQSIRSLLFLDGGMDNSP